ncbi:hypothetical protein A2U01_0081107, partial [Trifolium medium]|nr:hypothetical protein [Trifolium medium]
MMKNETKLKLIKDTVEYALKSQLRMSENPGLLAVFFAPGDKFFAPG